jgi:hypothetical protein
MYNGTAVLAAIDRNTVAVLLLCAIALGGTYLWFVEAIRACRRDRAYAFPFVCTLFWFAHDTSFVARFHTWFEVYDHWYVKFFWAGLVITACMEMVYIRQTIRFGRREMCPNLSQRAFTWVIIAAAASAVLIWAAVKQAIGEGQVLGDDLYMASFGFTVAVYPPFAIGMMLRRGSAAGQTVLMWVGFWGVAIGYFAASFYFGPEFRSWQWITLAVFSVIGGFVGTWLVRADRERGILGARRVPDDREHVVAA